MPYLRDGQEVSRSAFHAMLDADIANLETNIVDQNERTNAMEMLIDGKVIMVGRCEKTMHTYAIGKAIVPN